MSPDESRMLDPSRHRENPDLAMAESLDEAAALFGYIDNENVAAEDKQAIATIACALYQERCRQVEAQEARPPTPSAAPQPFSSRTMHHPDGLLLERPPRWSNDGIPNEKPLSATRPANE